MSLRERRDGEHIGPKRTVSARQIASLLGLKDAPPPEPPIPDTPAAARLRSEGKAAAADELMEAAKEHHAARVVPAGRDVIAALGIRPEELPVGVEETLGPPPKREPKREDGWQPDGSYDGAVNAPEPTAAELARAEKLRADFREHAAGVASRAEAARGTPRESAAAAEVAEVAELGSKIKAKLSKLGLAL